MPRVVRLVEADESNLSVINAATSAWKQLGDTPPTEEDANAYGQILLKIPEGAIITITYTVALENDNIKDEWYWSPMPT